MTSANPAPRTIDVGPQRGPQTKFLASEADIAIFGGSAGSGKTWSLLMEALRHVNNGGFRAVIFRRKQTEVRKVGGLWDESTALYGPLGAEPREQRLDWTFPSSAVVAFGGVEYEKDLLDWHGSQIALLGFDELTAFTERMFWYLLSRNRSMCGVRPYVRATCNPDPDSFVARLIDWWIGPEGYPIQERSGVLRWFVREGDVLVWADDPEELREKHPEIEPKSITFIPALLTDNPKLLAADPGYRANLLALNRVERERLLHGNWKIRPAAGDWFNRADVEIVQEVPPGGTTIRYWDKAGTEYKGEKGKGKARTASVKAKLVDGVLYILHAIAVQLEYGRRNKLMKQIAMLDGPDVKVLHEIEGGSGGKESAQETNKLLSGYAVSSDRPTGPKTSRWMGVSSAWSSGRVKVLAGRWNEDYLEEMHATEDKAGVRKDYADATAGAYAKLALGKTKKSGRARVSAWM